jgi:hypothetical protein
VRRLTLVAAAAAALGLAARAVASTLGPVAVQSVTAYAGASTVPTSSCSGGDDYDTWIDSPNPNQKHGGNATLRVNKQRPSYALVQFTPCAPGGAVVVSATLTLTFDTPPANTRTHTLYAITSNWAKSATWNTQPSVGGVSATATTGATETDWDVTSDVQSYLDGGTNDGWEIRDEDNRNSNALYDSSSGGTAPPSLAITYYP